MRFMLWHVALAGMVGIVAGAWGGWWWLKEEIKYWRSLYYCTEAGRDAERKFKARYK